MLLGVLTVVAASFLIICAAPFASHVLYKAGGGVFIIAGGYTVCSINYRAESLSYFFHFL